MTNTSVNPARSTGPALFVGGWALAQLWLFWVAPIVGAALAGASFTTASSQETDGMRARAATHRIRRSPSQASRLELPVVGPAGNPGP